MDFQAGSLTYVPSDLSDRFYCHLPEPAAELRFQYDHIIAQQHGGGSDEGNLALACFRCNSHKGPNLSGVDSISGEIERLFHPRLDAWEEHFHWQGPILEGRTAIGRATVAVLSINRPDAVMVRSALLAEEIEF